MSKKSFLGFIFFKSDNITSYEYHHSYDPSSFIFRKHIHTKNEKTQNERDLKELGIKYIRGKRRNLVDEYSDIRSSLCGVKSWKRRKIKKQYMKNI